MLVKMWKPAARPKVTRGLYATAVNAGADP